MDSNSIRYEKSILLEQDTIGLPEKKECLLYKKGEIETYRAHRILIKQSNFKSLANEILLSKEDLPQSVSENMRHENRRLDCSRKIPQHNVFLSKP